MGESNEQWQTPDDQSNNPPMEEKKPDPDTVKDRVKLHDEMKRHDSEKKKEADSVDHWMDEQLRTMSKSEEEKKEKDKAIDKPNEAEINTPLKINSYTERFAANEQHRSRGEVLAIEGVPRKVIALQAGVRFRSSEERRGRWERDRKHIEQELTKDQKKLKQTLPADERADVEVGINNLKEILARDAEFGDGVLHPGKPYYVFDETKSEILIGFIQDREEAWGWIPKKSAEQWNTRDVIINEKGEVDGYIQSTNASAAIVISVAGGELREMPIEDIKNQRAKYYSISELFQVLSHLTIISSEIGSGRIDKKMLQIFVKQNKGVDFVDIRPFQKALDKYPGSNPSFLERKQFSETLEQLRVWCREQTAIDEIMKKYSRENISAVVVPAN